MAIRYGVAKGIRMNIEPGSKAQRIIGTDEREIQSPFRKFSIQCPVFIDIGASDGYYGLIYRKYNAGGSAYLIDGKATFRAEQQEHFALNSYKTDNVSFLSGLVSSSSANGGIVVDEMLGRKTGQAIFLKIDVDGGEVEVLKGMKFTLENNPCKLIVETHSAELETSCIQLLKEMGYTSHIISQAWWRIFLPETRPTAHNRWFVAEKQ